MRRGRKVLQSSSTASYEQMSDRKVLVLSYVFLAHFFFTCLMVMCAIFYKITASGCRLKAELYEKEMMVVIQKVLKAISLKL